MSDAEDMSQVRIERLESHYSHLEDRMASQGRELSGITATLAQYGQTLNAINDKVNSPPSSTNWWALISAMAGLVLLCAGGVTMMIDPIRARTDLMMGVVSKNSNDVHNLEVKVGGNTPALEYLISRIGSHEERRHLLEEKVSNLESEASAASVSRTAIGEYLKEHTNKKEGH